MASYLAPLHQTLLEDSNNRHAAAATTQKLWELSPCEGMFWGSKSLFRRSSEWFEYLRLREWQFLARWAPTIGISKVNGRKSFRNCGSITYNPTQRGPMSLHLQLVFWVHHVNIMYRQVWRMWNLGISGKPNIYSCNKPLSKPPTPDTHGIFTYNYYLNYPFM